MHKMHLLSTVKKLFYFNTGYIIAYPSIYVKLLDYLFTKNF